MIFITDGSMVAEFAKANIPVFAMSDLLKPGNRRRLEAFVDGADLLNIHCVRDFAPARALMEILGVPTVVTLHMLGRLPRTGPPIIGVSNGVARMQHPSRETRTIHNGVDLGQFPRPPRKAARREIVLIRTCRPHRSVEYFWRALNPVGSSRVDLQACKLEYSIVSPK